MTIYYVDFTGGNDANGGLSDADAWKTITKVNGETLIPGDRIRFKRGETWTGIQLVIGWSGTASQPIVFEDYGTGAKPIIDGNDLINCIVAVGRSYLAFRNIEAMQGLDQGFYISGCDHINFADCDSHDCGNVGLEFDNSSFCRVIGGDFYDTYQRVGGTTNAGLTIGDDSYDILVDGVNCYGGTGVGTSGLTIHNHPATIYPYNVIIRNCNLYNNANSGLFMYKQDATVDADRNILVEDCLVYGSTTYGIYIYNAGVAYIDGVTINECTVRDNGSNALRVRADNVSVLRSLFSSAVNRPIWVTACVNMTFWNDTIYTTVAVVGDFLIVIENARTENFEMRNCIIRAESAGVNQISVVAGVPGAEIDIDYNLWGHTSGAARWWWLGAAKTWVNWLIDSSQDANSPIPADPLFVDPLTNDFTLQAGSPAIDAGVDVLLGYCGSAPDCGYWEYCVSVETIEGFTPWLDGQDEIPDISEDDECPR